jgi:hypothetical protein
VRKMKIISILTLALLLAGCGNAASLSPAPHRITLPSDAPSDELRRGDVVCKAQRDEAHVVVHIDELNLPLLVKPLSNAAGGRSNVVSVILSLRATGQIPATFSAIVTVPEMQPIVNGTNIVLDVARHVEEDLRRAGATQVVYHCLLHYGFWTQLYTNGLPGIAEEPEKVEQPTPPYSEPAGRPPQR